MLDITAPEIAALDDAELRELVGRLVEATLRSRGLCTAAITWGGDQNARDGGIDGRVELPSDANPGGFVPKPSTGFQVKKPALGPAAIRAEMRPGEKLRDSIAELAERGGAYIIVSSGSDLSDTELRRRLEAMRSAVADHPAAGALTLDFYDRKRLAIWVRDFPALSPWVLGKAGRPLQGWRSYGAWTPVVNGLPTEFVVDEIARIFDSTVRTGEAQLGMTILAGLQRMRTALGGSGTSVRLVGLSGVGKTRLVEALFDHRIGINSLDPSSAIYADLGAHPEPLPTAVATYLVNRRAPTIVVVDNCPADLHRQLTEICGVPGSTVNVLTIEYDIRDDSPERTEVFRLEASSAELVEKVVCVHCPWLSQVDAATIGRFSGGNSRVGIALAQTVRFGESLSGLSDEALFVRLFNQRHSDDLGLLAAAEACALVYSFDGEGRDGDEAELPRLAELANCSPAMLHRHLAELRRRGLLQQRSRWRAVLPHAIANRLASRALENIPRQLIEEQLVLTSERMLRSYSRRLGYLHDSETAVQIVEEWLSASGILGRHVGSLSSLGMSTLLNVAAAAPEAVLSAIERVRVEDPATEFFTFSNPHRDEFIRLLRKIAYDEDLFERCAALLVQFALFRPEVGARSSDTARRVWQSLFSPVLSGTRASVTQRLGVAEPLLWADNPDEHGLGIEALSAALETFNFVSEHDFSFGSRSRDYGYHPATTSERASWYAAWIGIAKKVGGSATASAPKIREALARHLPGLWIYTLNQELIELTVASFAAEGFWEDGWIAVKEAIWRHGKVPRGEAFARLEALEERLGPKTLAERIQAHVLRDRDWILEADDTSEGIAQGIKRADHRAEELGRCLAANPGLLDRLLPAIAGPGSGRRWQLGRGLARAEADKVALWCKLVDANTAAGDTANPSALIGFLSIWRESDPAAGRAVLEDALRNTKLIKLSPQLEVASGFDGSSADRLNRALASGAPASAFRILALGRLTDAIPTVELSRLLSAIAAAPNGWAVAVDILAMRLSSDGGDRTNLEQIYDVGRGLLLNLELSDKSVKQLDHDLAGLAASCLAGAAGRRVAEFVCQLLARAFGSTALSVYELHSLTQALFRTQPTAALDAFSNPPTEHSWWHPTVFSMFDETSRYQRSPIMEVEDHVLLEWCATSPDRNFVAAATGIVFSRVAADGPSLQWTELALELLERAPDPCSVLRAFIVRFTPHSWSGSRAALIEANAGLLAAQEESENASLADLARRERQRLLAEVRDERRREREWSRTADERFE